MTVTKDSQLRELLNLANPNDVADLLRKIKFGNMLCVIKITVASLTAIAAPDITSASVKAAATILGITLRTGELLPAIGQVVTLRVTASGTATSLGSYVATDSSGTPLLPPGGAGVSLGIAALAADGTTLTFPNTVTGFVLTYVPRAYGGADQLAEFAAPG